MWRDVSDEKMQESRRDVYDEETFKRDEGNKTDEEISRGSQTQCDRGCPDEGRSNSSSSVLLLYIIPFLPS